MNTWYQMWVRHSQKNVNAVTLMKHCDPVLQMFGALPCAPNGTPVIESDGTIEVRAYSKLGYNMAKQYLGEQGFVVEREQEND